MNTNVTKKSKVLNLTSENYNLRKYRILEIIDGLPSKTVKKLKLKIPVVLKITRQTFSRWCNLHINDANDIPALQLFKIANILQVEPKDLLNESLKNSIPKDVLNIEVKEAITITGLTK